MIRREDILKGPGAVKFDGALFHSDGGITATLEIPTEATKADIGGKLDEQKTDQTIKVAFTPCGRVSKKQLGVLFPHQNPNIGASIFGTTDTPLAIDAKNGRQLELVCAALTGMPTLRLSSKGALFGSAAEFTAILANGKMPGDTDALVKMGTAAYSSGSAAAFQLAGKRYEATWGEGVDAVIFADTEDGFTVSPKMTTDATTTDKAGTVDLFLSEVTCEATFTPQALTEAALLAMSGLNDPRGSSLGSGKNLVISAEGGLKVTLFNVSFSGANLHWAASGGRVGALTATAHMNEAGQLYKIEAPGLPDEPGDNG